MIYQTILFVLSISAINYVSCQSKLAEVTLQAGAINGTIHFAETEQGVHVTGALTGLPVGLYGLHVHEIGDVSTCNATGAHFNPEGSNHGGRDHAERHVGDLGNVQFVAGNGGSTAANLDFLDNVIALNGTNNILGRSVVLHGQEDDLGLGGHESSLTTGNAGARVACGIIREINSAGFVAPSLMVLTLTTVFMYISIK